MLFLLCISLHQEYSPDKGFFNIKIIFLTKKQIAEKLEIAEGTIAVHSKKIYKKLKINKLSELVSLMHKHGLK